MAKDLIPADLLDSLPAQMGDDDDFKDLSQSSDFLRRLQLVSKGKYVDSKQVGPGSYAVIIDGEKADDLGDKIDILVLARRPKALDMSDTSQVIVSYDKSSDLFQDIAARSSVKDSGCQYGVSFLIVERSTGCLYEFFCGSISLRREIPTLSAYMALSAAQIEARGLQGVEPHGPLPLTLGSRNIKKARYSWFVPVPQKCSTPFTASQVPKEEVIRKEMDRFINPPKDETEVVSTDGSDQRPR
ncbi:MAG: hypothetical protein ACYTFQ_17905 [Planctomycetota bacterium]|jgi:hypothetical protein